MNDYKILLCDCRSNKLQISLQLHFTELIWKNEMISFLHCSSVQCAAAFYNTYDQKWKFLVKRSLTYNLPSKSHNSNLGAV